MSDAEERNDKRPNSEGVGPTRSFDGSTARPLPDERQAVICLESTPLTLLGREQVRNTW